ncbi:MAG TPA: hypothetical protein VGI57_12955 [Usitatibacter sp.]
MTLAFLRRAAASLAFLAFAIPASATSTGIDYTDQWWGGQNESGWGVNFIEQGTTIFATLFVYGQDQTPRWFVATMNPSDGTNTNFGGSLAATTGPYYGGTWDPNLVHATVVGTMSVNFSNAYEGTMSYVANGVAVTKPIVRQTFKFNNLGGSYLGGMTANATSCKNGATNGTALIFGGLVVTQSIQQVSMVVSFYNGAGAASQCTYNGNLGGQGVMGQIVNGTFSCVVGGTTQNAGTFNLDNATMTQSGFSGLFTGIDQYCNYSGYFGGVKDVQ